MKIDLFDTAEFVRINNLKEVTSGILYERGNIPHPDGLVSNEIFGITVKSRKETFAYIDLHGYYFHPHIYKAIKRMFRNVEKIINGEEYYVIKNGKLIKSDDGETGIEFLYNNWEKIKWDYSDSFGMRNERVDLLKEFKKNEIFTRYQIVIPAFYRDVLSTSGGSGETGQLNPLYTKLIRMCSLVKSQSMFNFQLNSINFTIQNTMQDIYDYFKLKLEKKNGLFRKYLMGKNVDYSSRTVITSPAFHANTPNDMMTDFKHSAIPIHQVCADAYPFVMKYCRDFFDREIIQNKNAKMIFDPITQTSSEEIELDDPESYFNEKYIKTMMDTFIRDPGSRFNKIEVPVVGGTKKYLYFTGRRMDASNTSEVAAVSTRPMTWTDLLYRAAVEVTKDKHAMITRYPVSDEFGVFITSIRVVSTTKTEPMMIGATIYPWYPVIEPDIPHDMIGTRFIDSVQFSNSYLKGIDGDYDGDQTTLKIIFTQEANEECEQVMNSPQFFINATGKLIRFVASEAVQTFYCLTREPKSTDKVLPELTRKAIIEMKIEDLSFDKLVDMFGHQTDTTVDHRSTKRGTAKFKPTDRITIHASESAYKKEIETTVGRYIFNKYLGEDPGIINVLGYINEEVTNKYMGKMEEKIANALKNSDMTVPQIYKYIDNRDWLGFQLHTVITASCTMESLQTPKEVRALKKELLKKYEKELKAGDPRASGEIEKQLVAKTQEVLKDDPGMELYTSGSRGSIANNYKNMNLIRGAVPNHITGEFEIIQNSLMDGLDKKDIASHSNSILTGAYAKGVDTQVSGYYAKELLAALQTEILDEPGSDCGSKKTLTITVSGYNKNDLLYKYIKTNNGYKCLDPDVIDKYLGKTVQVRSPMFCIGEKICSKCAGEFYYKLGKRNIGLASSRIATTLVNLGMKKFHDATVKGKDIDINDMLL